MTTIESEIESPEPSTSPWNDEEKRSISRPTVALIGCGASGMSFLHALATRQKRQQRIVAAASSVDDEGETATSAAAENELCVLPKVTCYERSIRPGGIWVSHTEEEGSNEVSSTYCETLLDASSMDEPEVEEGRLPRMYNSLWSNRPKEAIEFSDYTFLEHFGEENPVPVYLPRRDLLQYLVRRATSVDPDLFDTAPEQQQQQRLHQIKFSTEVLSVEFDTVNTQFIVKSRSIDKNTSANEEEKKREHIDVARYDYCIWAGGQHGKPRIPRSILHLLRMGGSLTMMRESDSGDSDDGAINVPFRGTVLHSSHMSHFRHAVKNKRVVLIGDSSSAEDLALQAVKLGCQKCYILSRSGYGDCISASSWPKGINPTTGKMEPKVEVHIALPSRVFSDGTGFECNEMHWDEEDEVYEIDSEGKSISLNDIHTVVFCTGYLPDQDCLAAELQLPSLRMDDEEEEFWEPPPDFKMKPNPFTPEVGHIEPATELDFSTNVIAGVYRKMVLMSNPRMMYLTDVSSLYPILELDISAWQCLAYITGTARIPSRDEMEADSDAQMIEEMHIPYLRWCIDMDYFDELNDLSTNHWSTDFNDPRTKELTLQYIRYTIGILARNMRNAHYPVDLGTYNNLNEKGKRLVEVAFQDVAARHNIPNDTPESEWMTFRDICPKVFKSIHTGQEASALPGRWLDLDKGDKSMTSFTPTAKSEN